MKPLPCPLCGEIPLVNPASGHVLCCKIVADDIYAWNALPRALTWTTEPPKVAGWYWYSMGKGHAVCLLVCADGKAKLSKDHFTDAELLGGEWAGPIPAPVEG